MKGGAPPRRQGRKTYMLAPGSPVSMQAGLRWLKGPRDPRPQRVHAQAGAASPKTSALRGPRNPEEERKQDAYQERLFLFFVTHPSLGAGESRSCRACPGLAAAARSPGSGSGSGSSRVSLRLSQPLPACLSAGAAVPGLVP